MNIKEKKADLRSDPEKLKNRLEVNNTLILAIATLAITWCSYQSTLWDGIQTFRLVNASRCNRLVQERKILAGQYQAKDEAILIGFVNDVIENRMDKISFYMPRIRPELSSILKAWLATNPRDNPNAPAHPMEMQAYQQLLDSQLLDVNKLTKEAESSFDQAQQANIHSDRYSLFTVIFSMIMFMGAIASKMTRARLSFALIVISGLICFTILVLLFLYMPIAQE